MFKERREYPETKPREVKIVKCLPYSENDNRDVTVRISHRKYRISVSLNMFKTPFKEVLSLKDK